MMKLMFLVAFVAVVAAMPNGPTPMSSTPEGQASVRPIVNQEDTAPKAEELIEKDTATQEGTIEGQDDMDKAETFGFGYHKVIHVYPSYYPAYHHYPRYYHGYHYGHHW